MPEKRAMPEKAMPEPQISFAVPCEPVWDEYIRQLAITDRVLGYDPLTGEDGPSNIQWLQLGNRTLYLRKFLETGHSLEGHHALKDKDFKPGINIPEDRLALDHGTKDLYTAIGKVMLTAEELRTRADMMQDVSLSFSGAMIRLIPLSQEYSGNRSAYELFTDSVTSMHFMSTKLLGEIDGDESLDVESTAGLETGKSYVVCDEDGGRPEEVVIMSILTDRRIRCTERLRITRDRGIFASTNLLADPDSLTGAVANGDFTYISKELDVLADASSGRLIVCRDSGEITATAEYRLAGSSVWRTAEPLPGREYSDGTVDDNFALPQGTMTIRLRYTGGTYPFKVRYIVVRPVVAVTWIEDIRQPEIFSASCHDGNITIRGSKYGTLYGIPIAYMEATVSASVYMGDDDYSVTIPAEDVEDGSITFPLPPELADAPALYLRIRHADTEGSVSRWSDIYIHMDPTV